MFFKKPIFILFVVAVCLLGGTYLYLKKRRPPVAEITALSDEEKKISNTNFFYDLETTTGLNGVENIKPCTAHSGKMACELIGGKEYGPSIVKKIGDVSTMPLKRAAASVWVYALTDNPGVVLTATIMNSKNESVFWDGKSSEKLNFEKNKWTKINALYNFPADKIKPDDVLQINVWNKGKTDVIIDDIEIVYGESADRRGTPSVIDPNAIYEKQFVPQRNKPPFPIMYFRKEEIHNENTTYITPDKTKPTTDLSPNDEFLVGDFLTDNTNLEELVCIKNNMFLFFQFDSDKHQFKQELEITLNASEQEEWSAGTKKFAGDFNADGKVDVLVVQPKKNSWKLFTLKNKSWSKLLEGSTNGLNSDWWNDNYSPFVSNYFSNKKTDALVLIDNTHRYSLQLNKSTTVLEEKTESLSANDIGLFKKTSLVYEVSFEANGKEFFLKLDTDWRFDFKMMSITPDGFVITNNVDFKGYSNDCNPKYYEFVKIISGKFTSQTKSSLLVLMRNCADVDFDGKHCKTYEQVSYLPNSLQLYMLGD
jgi:hypothetical protein